MMRVYTDSDTYVSFSFKRMANAYYESLTAKGKFALIVEHCGAYVLAEGTFFEGEMCFTDEQFTKFLQSL